MYFDTAYVAKFYLDESDSLQVRQLVQASGSIYTSALTLAEFQAVLHRRTREGLLSTQNASRLAAGFSSDVESRLWLLHSTSDALMRRTADLIAKISHEIFLRAADAIHLTTARDAGELEIWTNDRHMLAAAPHFGLKGRSV